MLLILFAHVSKLHADNIKETMYINKPSAESTNSLFPSSKTWPKELQCIKYKTKAYSDNNTQTLDHRDLYNFNFSNGTWSDFKHSGYLKYLGEDDEFSVAYALHDEKGYFFKIITITRTPKGIVATRAEVIGDTIFAYWSNCKVVQK